MWILLRFQVAQPCSIPTESWLSLRFNPLRTCRRRKKFLSSSNSFSACQNLLVIYFIPSPCNFFFRPIHIYYKFPFVYLSAILFFYFVAVVHQSHEPLHIRIKTYILYTHTNRTMSGIRAGPFGCVTKEWERPPSTAVVLVSSRKLDTILFCLGVRCLSIHTSTNSSSGEKNNQTAVD